MNQAKQLYEKLERLLIAQNYITQVQSTIVCRRGKRKEWAWKRHVIDLSEFVLSQRIVNSETEMLLTEAIKWCKT